MRDKQKETVLKKLRKNAKLEPEECNWILDQFKLLDNSIEKDRLLRKLSAMQLTFTCNKSDYLATVQAVQEMQKFIQRS